MDDKKVKADNVYDRVFTGSTLGKYHAVQNMWKKSILGYERELNQLKQIYDGYIGDFDYENVDYDTLTHKEFDKMYFIYRLKVNGLIIDKDEDAALDILHNLAIRGDYTAFKDLVDKYEKLKDYDKVYYYTEIYSKFNSSYLFELAQYNIEGKGTVVNIEKGINYYKELAFSGDEKSILFLANCYKEGLYVAQDIEECLYYFNMIENPDNRLKIEIANIYMDEDYNRVNYDKAIELLESVELRFEYDDFSLNIYKNLALCYKGRNILGDEDYYDNYINKIRNIRGELSKQVLLDIGYTEPVEPEIIIPKLDKKFVLWEVVELIIFILCIILGSLYELDFNINIILINILCVVFIISFFSKGIILYNIYRKLKQLDISILCLYLILFIPGLIFGIIALVSNTNFNLFYILLGQLFVYLFTKILNFILWLRIC